MKQITRRGAGLLLTLALLLALMPQASAAALTPDQAARSAADYVYRTVPSPQVGSVGGEWAVLGLARYGYDAGQAYWDGYYAALADYTATRQGTLHARKYTEYARVVLALTAIGADPTDVAGYDLLAPLGDFDQVVWQGVNGPIWALLALDCGNYDVPTAAPGKVQATRQKYVDELLARQRADGGWSLTASAAEADPDVTAMALQALAGYQSQAAVQAAIGRGLTCLSRLQNASGGFSGNDASSESVVQVLVALCALGLSPEDSRFQKNGHTLLDALLSFRQADGSFAHTAGGGTDLMATEQALYGLAAVLRARSGQPGLYRMEDVTIHVTGHSAPAIGLPGRSAAVRYVPVSAPGTTFSDIQGHRAQADIEALAARGIITGKGADRFDPNATMTRAEFAAIVVRALGLTPEATAAFTDVVSGQWYAPYVGAAHSRGIITGVGGGLFRPQGTITRQQAAVMVARAAALCGMDTGLSAGRTEQLLSALSDGGQVDPWARAGVAFCCDQGLWPQSGSVEPGRAILRCEVAQLLCGLLDRAALLS